MSNLSENMVHSSFEGLAAIIGVGEENDKNNRQFRETPYGT